MEAIQHSCARRRKIAGAARSIAGEDRWAKFPSSEAGPSDTAKSTFSLRFAVYTTVVCRVFYRGHEGATSDIARWFRVESWLRVVRWRASLAGVAGGRRWRASLAGSLAKTTKRPISSIKATKTTHTSQNHHQNSAQRTPSGGGTREIPSPSADKTPPIDLHRVSWSENE